MKTLNEIKRNIIAFYSRIQNRVTDFSVGSVVHDIIFSFSAALEDVHREIDSVERQAYVATASGEYLDKLIEGTFQLQRTKSSNSIGYVVVYGESPLSNPGNVKLRYADFDYNTGKFISGLQGATKFIGHNNQGDEGIVFALIQPRNGSAIVPSTRMIDLGGRNVQYLILPVASILSGSQSNIVEGGLSTFPSPPPGLSRVLNTSNPGLIFFSTGQPLSAAPFYSRFTEIGGYSGGVLSVTNAYNFSKRGFLEISRSVSDKLLVATYSDEPLGTPGATIRQGGLIFEYIDRTTTSISLKDTILGSPLPYMTINDGGTLKTLTLRSFSYDNILYSEGAMFKQTLDSFLSNTSGLVAQQRPDQISETLIFDPDNVLTSDYRIPATHMVAGGEDEAGDEEYRESLRKYLNSLSRATASALEAGALRIPGISFAKTLPPHMSLRGSTTVLVSNEDGVVSPAKRAEVRESLDAEWKAAGVNLVVLAPELLKTHLSLVVRPIPGESRSSIYTRIVEEISSYLKSKNPGDSIRYSEILSRLNTLQSVENVFNLLILKELTPTTYTENKSEYDLAFLSHLSTIEEGVQINGNPVVPGDRVQITSVNPLEAVRVASNDPSADGVVYYSYMSGMMQYADVLTGPVEKVSKAYSDVIPALSVEEYKRAVLENKSSLTNDDYEYLYITSYLFSESLNEISGAYELPVTPTNIEYRFVTDYMTTQMQLLRLNSINVSSDTIMPLVGIKFL